MAITVTLKTHDHDDTATASSTTFATSFTPLDNTLYWIYLTGRDGAGLNSQPTLTGNGNTYTFISEQGAIGASNGKWSCVFRGMMTGGSNGALTFARSGAVDTWSHIECVVLEIAGTDTTGTQGSGAVLQTVPGTLDTGISTTFTINITMGSGSALVSGFSKYSGADTATARASWTDKVNETWGGGSNRVDVQSLVGTDTAASVTWQTNAGLSVGYVSEIKAASSGRSLFYQNSLEGIGGVGPINFYQGGGGAGPSAVDRAVRKWRRSNYVYSNGIWRKAA